MTELVKGKEKYFKKPTATFEFVIQQDKLVRDGSYF
jgi:hypothetical protein